MLRDDIKAAQVAAMKAKDSARTSALRLILSRVKDRDIELRTEGGAKDDDTMIVEVLQKMVKQRRESISMYESGGRQELADAEKAEVAVIEEFLPAMKDEEETGAIIDAIIAELGAQGPQDMGKVMGQLKARHGGEIDMGKASGLVKVRLTGG
ncbi:GatB/YqeY domain-containing protein [Parasphingopyxis algicola]|uniref:GatB/YqeY domain-containing protein n=1 Tax=Parasphingopyxis algicola TaxID=2026624 RepID=UPI0015A2D287|nr:GatB/YqeY domain-containing protein [Parasphingopyxis algicola]QLC24224.1 GatB/YqeY domain-containing protein [Parasphingopyxis algicola]